MKKLLLTIAAAALSFLALSAEEKTKAGEQVLFHDSILLFTPHPGTTGVG